jgi:formylglycine-generating enzyme required for sulfatase activity
MSDPIKLFVSYSHQDAKYLADDSLLGYLKGLEKEEVSFWTDRHIGAGELWDEVIKDNLQDAQIALVLVSQAFLDSPYCQNVEIQSLLAQQVHLIPVILSACEWQHHEWLSSRQFLPGGDKTIEEHYIRPGMRKRLFREIRRQLRERVESIRRNTLGPTAFNRYYQSRIDEWSTPRYALDKRFVHLTLLLDQGEKAQGPRWAAQERKFQDLQEVLANVPDQAIVLLGPPGSGKSTLLRHFELDNAAAMLESRNHNDLAKTPLTFFVPLNDYKTRNPNAALPLPKDWLGPRWADKYPELPRLDTVLRDKRLTLLLDALNEIPGPGDEPIRLWKDFLLELNRNYPGNRVIFSCRSLDYSAPLSSKDLPVPQVRIEPLSDDQVKRFVELYCPQHGKILWRNLEGSPQLELLRSPYYMKLLVEQADEGEIPEGRAALFTGFVRRALRREVKANNPLFAADELLHQRDLRKLTHWRWKTPYELPSRGLLFEKLSTLAYAMQAQRSDQEAAQLRIAYDEALDILDHDRDEDILKAGEALGVLEEDLARDEVLYIHQLLQEYFAAIQLAKTPEPQLVQVAWQDDKVSPNLADTLVRIADSDPLPLLPATGWEETTVLAAAMMENPDRVVAALMKVNLPLAGRCAAQPDVPVSQALSIELQQALIERAQDPRADLRARIAGGLALGRLGDPRFERHGGLYGEYLLPPLVKIPGGPYTLGSDEGLYEDEGPAHSVQLEPFLIGQFPVTNAEWACFLKAGGYEEARWWVTAEDKAWWQGESSAEGPKRQWRENRQLFQQNFDQIRVWQQEGRITSAQAEDWEQIAQMRDNEFEELLERWYPPGHQTQPAYWSDDAFNNPAQPVVGISWHEARAYCAWLSAQTDQDFRLPTEAQWEAAARGQEARRYAYGDKFDAALCNTFETHIRRTTPIRLFPGGDTPDGLVDMTGNVWDWTSSLYRPYPYEATDGRENPITGDGRRVVRGGSWGYYQVLARPAYRLRSDPDDRGGNVGVRLVCSSPIF